MLDRISDALEDGASTRDIVKHLSEKMDPAIFTSLVSECTAHMQPEEYKSVWADIPWELRNVA